MTTEAMHLPHARDGDANVVMALDALAVDWLAKPFDYTDMTAGAGRAFREGGVDIVSDLLGDFFPMCILSVVIGMATRATNGARAEMRCFSRGRFFGWTICGRNFVW